MLMMKPKKKGCDLYCVSATNGKRIMHVGAYADKITADRVRNIVPILINSKWSAVKENT